MGLTDWINDNQNYVDLQHTCLPVSSRSESFVNSRQIIAFCLTERPTKWNIAENKFDKKHTFAELYHQHTTLEQLYLWSAPIDIIEQYQFYVERISSSNQFLSMETDIFYNCTLPRFGSSCEYSLDINTSHNSALDKTVSDFYGVSYNPTKFTCYTHLECHRGLASIRLDWTKICDGFIDCSKDGMDEEYCWQLQMNQCKDDEYRCQNGQCIPKEFLGDDRHAIECLDESDKALSIKYDGISYNIYEPTVFNEERQCSRTHLSPTLTLASSCVEKRNKMMQTMLFSQTPNATTDDCWLAFKCYYNILDQFGSVCQHISMDQSYIEIIENKCPKILFMPSTPIVFGHVYLGYFKDMLLQASDSIEPHLICYN